MTTLRRPAPARGPADPAQRVGLRARRPRSSRPGSRRSGRRASASRPASASATGSGTRWEETRALALRLVAARTRTSRSTSSTGSPTTRTRWRSTRRNSGRRRHQPRGPPRRPRPPRRRDRRRQGRGSRTCSSTRAPTRTGCATASSRTRSTAAALYVEAGADGVFVPGLPLERHRRVHGRDRRAAQRPLPARADRRGAGRARRRADQHRLDAVPGGAADGRSPRPSRSAPATTSAAPSYRATPPSTASRVTNCLRAAARRGSSDEANSQRTATAPVRAW